MSLFDRVSGGVVNQDLPFADILESRLAWDYPRTIGDLADDSHVSRRVVEKAVEELRRRGAPVVSDSRGVFLTRNADVLMDSYRRLRRRALTQMANLRRMKRTAVALRGYQQVTLFGEDDL